jgi:hypothetical protein
MSETNGNTPEQAAQPQPQLQIQLAPQGVVLTFPVTLALDNEMMGQLVRAYLQAHPELLQEIVKGTVQQKQQELAVIQAVKRSRND